jgi:hypothetical protein
VRRLSARIAAIEQELEVLLASAVAAGATTAPLQAWLRDAAALRTVLEQGTTEERRELLARAVDTVICRGKEDPAIVWKPWAAALIEITGITLPPPVRRAGRPANGNHPCLDK